MANGYDSNLALAVLIDADNTNPAIIEGLIAEVAMLGVSSVKRIYGDWTTPQLASWSFRSSRFSSSDTRPERMQQTAQ
jgi:hypothetical protein